MLLSSNHYVRPEHSVWASRVTCVCVCERRREQERVKCCLGREVREVIYGLLSSSGANIHKVLSRVMEIYIIIFFMMRSVNN